MKKLLATVALVLGLLGITTFAQAAWVDVGYDTFGEKYWVENWGMDVSRNGVTYLTLAIEITTTPEGRAYWKIPDTVAYYGLLRVVDCKGKRFATIQEAFYGADGMIFWKSDVARDWDWVRIPPSNTTIMGVIWERFCN